MKTTWLLSTIILVITIQLHGQGSIRVRESQSYGTIMVPAGQLRLLYIITADNKKLQLQETDSLSLGGALNLINPDWIQTISVLKDKAATDQYGAPGQNGVILVSLKEGALKEMPAALAMKFKKEERN
jgi:TonB-dependent SusC/RagA subfamily outer membrane receptor